MTNKTAEIILLIIKNINEGDGSSLKMINSSLNILLRNEEYQILFNNEFNLNSMINDLIKLKYITINTINNYELTELGNKQLKIK